MSQITRSNAEALLEPDVGAEIIQGTVKSSVAMQLFRRGPDMSSSMVRMKVLDTLPVTYWVDNDTDNGRKKLTKMAWDNKYIVAEELAVIVPIKEDLLDDADIDIWAQVRPRISEAFAKSFDEAVFTGKNKPKGFRADLLTSIKNAGAQITPGQDTLYKQIDNAMAKVEESDYEPTALLGGLNMKSQFRNMLDTTGQPLNQTEIGSLARYYVNNGAWDKTKAKFIVGDFSQAVYAIRQDITYKLLTEAIIQDPTTGEILYNLAQDDMVALRVTMRLGWEIPNPINAEQPDESVRFPFAAVAGDTPITTYNAVFTVTNGKSGDSLEKYEGVKVTCGGVVKKTGSDGTATFPLQNGTYNYRVKMDGFNTEVGKVTVNGAAAAIAITLVED